MEWIIKKIILIYYESYFNGDDDVNDDVADDDGYGTDGDNHYDNGENYQWVIRQVFNWEMPKTVFTNKF